VIKGNLAYQWDGIAWDVYAYSLVFAGTDGQIVNNTGAFDASGCIVRPGIGLEEELRNYTIQGNVISATPGNCGWATLVAQSGGQPNTGSMTYNDNVFCGPVTGGGLSIGSDGGSFTGTVTETGDYWAQQFSWSGPVRKQRWRGNVTAMAAHCLSEVIQYVAPLPLASLRHSE
jgi:hypothetical protein